jgi:hypothetical protein
MSEQKVRGVAESAGICKSMYDSECIYGVTGRNGIKKGELS